MSLVPSSASLSLAAPIANEDEREHFQRRLGWAALLMFVLGGGFWLVTVVSVAIVAPELFTSMFVSPGAMLQIATFTTALIVWFVVRRTPRSAAALSFLDVFTSVAMSWGWSLMVAFGTKGPRFELIALLACTYTLVTRAALVPSRAVRTAAISLASLSLLIPVTYRMYGEGEQSGPLRPVIYQSIWIVVAVGCTAVISGVIYGLRQEVRQAMRLGQYWLEEKMGEGGMGTVFRASHAMLRRPTAIKLLHEGTGSKDRLERFEREVQITARLTHPNTIAIYDYGRTPDGVFYYAMEYLEGISLDGLVATTVGNRSAASSICCSRCAERSKRRTRRASCTGTSSRPTSC